MPFIIRKTDQCPASRPWGVLTETAHGSGKTTGKPHGCFPSKAAAREQQKALYVNVPEAKSLAPPPPNLRASNSATRRCQHCEMYTGAVCWGYGNYDVDASEVCDSFEPEPSESKSESGNPEVPMDPSTIEDAPGLQAAIVSLSRADDSHDAERRALASRAAELENADLLPDNWNSAGALVNRDQVYSNDEQRETYNDLRTALSNALSEQVEEHCWLQDFDDSRAYYCSEGSLWACDYSIGDDAVTLGEPERVRPSTSYVLDKGGERSERRSRVPHTLEYRKAKAGALSLGDKRRATPRPASEPLELRGEAKDGTRVLRSYASLFEVPYTVGGGTYRYEETMKRGSFKRTLGRSPDVVLRVDHAGPPLAATWNDTLRLGEDDRGLWYEADLQVGADAQAASIAAKIARGDMRESSFAFRCAKDEWNEDYSKRTVSEAELDRGDVSVVTFGASRATGQHMLLRSEESLLALREVGFEAFLEAWTEWRNFTLLPLDDRREERAGKIISSQSMQVLQKVLDLVADADEAVDEAQPLLADLMGVPNPDDDSSEANSEQSDVEERSPLSTKARNSLPSTAFVFPKERRYPIPDISHARNALARASGKSEEAAVKRAVYKKYPSLKPSAQRFELAPNDTEELLFAARTLIIRSER